MSDILGYDSQGEALRAGDRVRHVRTGREAHIRGPVPAMARYLGAEFEVDVSAPDTANGWQVQKGANVRLINSGRDLFEKARDRALSQGNPDARTEPTTTERAQAWISGQPWTEPS